MQIVNLNECTFMNIILEITPSSGLKGLFKFISFSKLTLHLRAFPISKFHIENREQKFFFLFCLFYLFHKIVNYRRRRGNRVYFDWHSDKIDFLVSWTRNFMIPKNLFQQNRKLWVSFQFGIVEIVQPVW